MIEKENIVEQKMNVFMWRIKELQKSDYGILFFLILILAFAVRLGIWAAYLNNPGHFFLPDTLSYLEPGRHLLLNGSFPSFLRTPVYPLFLAAVSIIVSSDPAILALVHIVISLITIVLIYDLSLRMFGLKTALLAMLFMALDITSAISANQILSETLFTLFLMICIIWLSHFQRKGKVEHTNFTTIALIGIGFSVLTLTRPIAVFLFIIIAGWLYFTLKKYKKNLLKIIILFSIFSMLLPVSWIVRNHAHTNVYFLTTVSSKNLYQYRAAWNVSRTSNRLFTDVRAEFKQKAALKKKNENLNDGEIAQWEQSEGIKILKEKPLLTLYQGFQGLIKMYLGISNADINNLYFSRESKQYGINNNAGASVIKILRDFKSANVPLWFAGIKIWALGYLVLLYLGVLYSIVKILKKRFTLEQQHLIWLILIVIAYFTFFSAGVETYSRFRVPVAPLLSILGGLGWISFFSRIRLFYTQRKAIVLK